MPHRYRIIDIFAGAGGLALGFHQTRKFDTILAVEMEEDFATTFELNFHCPVIVTPIEKLLENGGVVAKADVVIGGPPCQGFSNLTGNRPSDPRRELWQYFMDIVEQSEAKVFLVENVPNLLSSPEGKGIMERAGRMGFDYIDAKVLLASKFGVPQNRKRAFILASRLGPVNLPEGNGQRETVREAFKGIPPTPTQRDVAGVVVLCGEQLHIARNPTPTSMERYKLIPKGGNRFDLQQKARHLTPGCWLRKQKGGTDLFGRLEWDEPAHCTIRTEFYKPEKGRYLHPEEHRPITHWEAARLQTFPDDFKFYGTKIRIAIQIGNAVPPRLAKALAGYICDHLTARRRKWSLAPG